MVLILRIPCQKEKACLVLLLDIRLVRCGAVASVDTVGLLKEFVFRLVLPVWPMQFLFKHGLRLDILELGLEICEVLGVAIRATAAIGKGVFVVVHLITRTAPK